MSPVFLLEITAKTYAGADTIVRLCSTHSGPDTCALNGVRWFPVLKGLGSRSITLVSNGELSGTNNSFGAASWNHTLANFSNIQFNNSPARVWKGNDGEPFSSFTQVFVGKIGKIAVSGLEASAAFTGLDTDLDVDFLTATYAGTGQAEGPADFKGTLKPVALGFCENVSPVLLDSSTLIYQVHAGACEAIPSVYEGANTLGAPVAARPTTIEDLAGLSLAAGQWAVAPALGMFRLSRVPSQKITADVQGPASYGTTIGSIVAALIAQAIPGASIDPSIAAFSQSWNVYSTSATTYGDLVRGALAQAGGYLVLKSDGGFGAGRFFGNSTVKGVLREDRSTAPLVQSAEQKDTASPAYKVSIGGRRNWTVFSDTEVNDAVKQAATTAVWSGVTGSGKPQDNATVGAPAGTMVAGVKAEDLVNAFMSGADADSTPPAVPINFIFSAPPATLDANGQPITKIAATWNPPGDADLGGYELSIAQTGGNAIVFPIGLPTPATGQASWEQIVLPNVEFTAQVRALDKSGNRGAYTAAQTITSAKDTAAPNPPTGLAISPAFSSLFLNWTNDTATDLAGVEVWEAFTADTAGRQLLTTVNAAPGKAGGYTRSGFSAPTTAFYWLRSRDTSGNVSGFTSPISATTAKVDGGSIAAQTITGANIVGGAITGDLIQAGSISGDRISSNSSLPASLTIGDTGFALSTLQGAVQGATGGGNRVPYSDMESGVAGYIAASSGATLSEWNAGFANNGINYANARWTGLNPGSYVLTATKRFPLSPGEIVSYQAVLGGFGTIVGTQRVDLVVYDLNNNVVPGGNPSIDAPNAGAVSFPTVVGDFYAVPAGAVSGELRVVLDKGVTSRCDPGITLARPMVASASPGQTVLPPYAPSGNTPNAADVVNAQSTTRIDPGKILIAGNTSLSDWRTGGDETHINGGAISANTITANKVSIGVRGVSLLDISFDTNRVNTATWSGGYVEWIGDNNERRVDYVRGESCYYDPNQPVAVAFIWFDRAVSPNYFGDASGRLFSGMPAGGAAEILANANNVILATYRNGTNLTVDYGRTVIDGDYVKTGTVNADRLVANSITANQMGANAIYAAHIVAGEITTDKIQIGGVATNRVADNAITNGAFELNPNSASGQGGLDVNPGSYAVYEGTYTYWNGEYYDQANYPGWQMLIAAGYSIGGPARFDCIANVKQSHSGAASPNWAIRLIIDGTVVDEAWGQAPCDKITLMGSKNVDTGYRVAYLQWQGGGSVQVFNPRLKNSWSYK